MGFGQSVVLCVFSSEGDTRGRSSLRERRSTVTTSRKVSCIGDVDRTIGAVSLFLRQASMMLLGRIVLLVVLVQSVFWYRLRVTSVIVSVLGRQHVSVWSKVFCSSVRSMN